MVDRDGTTALNERSRGRLLLVCFAGLYPSRKGNLVHIRRLESVGLAALLLAAPAVAAEGLAWTEDAKAATATAAKENKDLLINFTGSDWCGWCVKLDKEVFSQEAFTKAAPEHFVFLKLDFPRKRELSDEVKTQNAEWKARMPVRGFPTIVLADAQGRPYATTGYQRGGPEPYLKNLAELREIKAKRDAALAKAGKAEGAEKAKALDEALTAVGTDIAMASYGDLMDEIVKLDADGKAGLKQKYEAVALMGKINAAVSKRDFAGAIQIADGALKAIGDTGQSAQDIYFARAMAYYQSKDKTAAKADLETARKAAPEGTKASRIKMILERYFKDEK